MLSINGAYPCLLLPFTPCSEPWVCQGPTQVDFLFHRRQEDRFQGARKGALPVCFFFACVILLRFDSYFLVVCTRPESGWRRFKAEPSWTNRRACMMPFRRTTYFLFNPLKATRHVIYLVSKSNGAPPSASENTDRTLLLLFPLYHLSPNVLVLPCFPSLLTSIYSCNNRLLPFLFLIMFPTSSSLFLLFSYSRVKKFL